MSRVRLTKRQREILERSEARSRASTGMAMTARQRRLAEGRIPQIPRGYPHGVMAGEMKFYDTTVSDTDVDTNATITCLNCMQEGSSVSTRVGRQITMRSVEAQLMVYQNGAATGGVLAIAIVYDRQTNAAAPSWTDIWTADTHSNMMRNHDNKRRFKVLHRDRIALPSVGADVTNVTIEFYRKLRHPTEYNGTNGGTVADITTGGLFLCYQGSQTPGADDGTLKGRVRVRYVDN
jgi:hypothetical protein